MCLRSIGPLAKVLSFGVPGRPAPAKVVRFADRRRYSDAKAYRESLDRETRANSEFFSRWRSFERQRRRPTKFEATARHIGSGASGDPHTCVIDLTLTLSPRGPQFVSAIPRQF